MKLTRQETIKKIIEAQVIGTQADLTTALQAEGFKVTQATVSRDIKEMMLVKVPDAFGGFRYSFPEERETRLTSHRMNRTFEDSILAVHQSENILVVRTMPGTANAVAYVIDYLKMSEVLGSIAGDDTIFICLANKEAGEKVKQRLGVKK